jgi:D-serine deaminase-like pyridoxal phosphate-dependent protein
MLAEAFASALSAIVLLSAVLTKALPAALPATRALPSVHAEPFAAALVACPSPSPMIADAGSKAVGTLVRPSAVLT